MSTMDFVKSLEQLKSGELQTLRNHAGLGLDESVSGFDFFAGLWWPLRQKNQRAPRRHVAWLSAKLFALSQIKNTPGRELAACLGELRFGRNQEHKRMDGLFNRLLAAPLDQIEPLLSQALSMIDSNTGIDWVKLIDDLSTWESAEVRQKWTNLYIKHKGEDS